MSHLFACNFLVSGTLIGIQGEDGMTTMSKLTAMNTAEEQCFLLFFVGL